MKLMDAENVYVWIGLGVQAWDAMSDDPCGPSHGTLSKEGPRHTGKQRYSAPDFGPG